MIDSKLNRKDSATPDRDLSSNPTRERETAPLPGGVPGWVAIPIYPVPKELKR